MLYFFVYFGYIAFFMINMGVCVCEYIHISKKEK